MLFSDGFIRLASPFVLLACLLLAGGQLDALVLYGALGLGAWAACVFNGAILTLYMIENWGMMQDIKILSGSNTYTKLRVSWPWRTCCG